jgi:glutathione S-transferase
MILIGMFDSPFVRRVALSMRLLGIPFEHRNWSVGKDQAAIREINPVGRVPTLVLDDGEVLMESSAILDHLDQAVGPERALLPVGGAERRRALFLMALATGACDKAVLQLYEHVFRPAEKVHQPWLDRQREQMSDALRALDTACAARPGQPLVGTRMSQADITVTCAWTFISEALAVPATQYPALASHAARYEANPEFAAIHIPFFAPGSPAPAASH